MVTRGRPVLQGPGHNGAPGSLPVSPERPLLTFAQAAQALGVGLRTVKGWAAGGTLPTVRMGRRVVRIHADDLAAFVAAGRVSR